MKFVGRTATCMAGILASLMLAVAAEAQEPQPEVPWGVYAVVSTGPHTYGGEKTRAVLVYGEIGDPHLTIEKVRVVYGSPGASRVLWAEEIDVGGDIPEGEILSSSRNLVRGDRGVALGR